MQTLQKNVLFSPPNKDEPGYFLWRGGLIFNFFSEKPQNQKFEPILNGQRTKEGDSTLHTALANQELELFTRKTSFQYAQLESGNFVAFFLIKKFVDVEHYAPPPRRSTLLYNYDLGEVIHFFFSLLSPDPARSFRIVGGWRGGGEKIYPLKLEKKRNLLFLYLFLITFNMNFTYM